MSVLLDLATRCEQATGPDRELDLRIKAAVYGGEARVSPHNGEWCLYDGIDRNGRERIKERPHTVSHAAWSTDRFTASLDAAMTLALRGRAQLVLEGAIAACLLVTNHRSDDFVQRLPAFVSAAALRARAAQ